MKGSEVIRVDVFGYGLTYAHGQYVMSSGRVVEALPSPVVRIETRDGPTGYGESCPLGATYLPALGGGQGRRGRAGSSSVRRGGHQPGRGLGSHGCHPAGPCIC